MVEVREEKRGNKTYYYLEHSIREKNQVRKKRLYLGEKLPKNLKLKKKEFFHDIMKEKLFPDLDKIKKLYSKHQKSTPISAKKKEIEIFSIKFTYDTQRIEGSTLTLHETADLLEKGLTPKTKPVEDAKEAEAHKEVFYEMLEYKKDLSFQTVLGWHRKLLIKTHSDIAGKIRKHQVGIARSKFIPPLPVEMNLLLQDFFKWYKKNRDKIHPVELAALVHLKFVTIHPFTDGNGRISRLIMNFVLNNHKYPMRSIHYSNRDSYYTALERAQVKQEEYIFVQWFIKRYIKEMKKKLPY